MPGRHGERRGGSATNCCSHKNVASRVVPKVSILQRVQSRVHGVVVRHIAQRQPAEDAGAKPGGGSAARGVGCAE